ncbi:MAG TPA: hypothetical protein VNZ52_08580 [Candidatus Thermoplasmatota archaeon]|nr:hypothetical protein [Candidatus Thermoplasmatota archaeon]
MTRLRPLLLVLALLLTSLPLVPPGGAADCPGVLGWESGEPYPVNPLVNADFELGLASAFETGEPLTNELLTGVAGLAPGLLENRSDVLVPGWSFRPLRGSEHPASRLEWGPRLGDASRLNPEARDGAVRVTYDPRDAASEVPILVQALGQRPLAGTVSAPLQVSAWLHAPTPGNRVAVVAGVYLVGEEEPVLSLTTWTPTPAFQRGFQQAHFTFPPMGDATATQLFFAFLPMGPESAGGQVVVDDVTYGTAFLRPAVHSCPFPSGVPWTYLP